MDKKINIITKKYNELFEESHKLYNELKQFIKEKGEYSGGPEKINKLRANLLEQNSELNQTGIHLQKLLSEFDYTTVSNEIINYELAEIDVRLKKNILAKEKLLIEFDSSRYGPMPLMMKQAINNEMDILANDMKLTNFYLEILKENLSIRDKAAREIIEKELKRNVSNGVISKANSISILNSNPVQNYLDLQNYLVDLTPDGEKRLNAVMESMHTGLDEILKSNIDIEQRMKDLFNGKDTGVALCKFIKPETYTIPELKHMLKEFEVALGVKIPEKIRNVTIKACICYIILSVLKMKPETFIGKIIAEQLKK
jgi:hypothetical protein